MQKPNRIKTTHIFFLILGAFAFFCAPLPAHALLCLGTPEEKAAKADIIFEGWLLREGQEKSADNKFYLSRTAHIDGKEFPLWRYYIHEILKGDDVLNDLSRGLKENGMSPQRMDGSGKFIDIVNKGIGWHHIKRDSAFLMWPAIILAEVQQTDNGQKYVFHSNCTWGSFKYSVDYDLRISDDYLRLKNAAIKNQ